MTGDEAGSADGLRAQRDYRPAFLRYLARRDETSRTAGYDLGREAVVGGLSLLDLVDAHHVTLLEVLPDACDRAEAAAMCTAAAEFLSEVLASFSMASGALPDVQQRLVRAEQELADLRAGPPPGSVASQGTGLRAQSTR